MQTEYKNFEEFQKEIKQEYITSPSIVSTLILLFILCFALTQDLITGTVLYQISDIKQVLPVALICIISYYKPKFWNMAMIICYLITTIEQCDLFNQALNYIQDEQKKVQYSIIGVFTIVQISYIPLIVGINVFERMISHVIFVVFLSFKLGKAYDLTDPLISAYLTPAFLFLIIIVLICYLHQKNLDSTIKSLWQKMQTHKKWEKAMNISLSQPLIICKYEDQLLQVFQNQASQQLLKNNQYDLDKSHEFLKNINISSYIEELEQKNHEQCLNVHNIEDIIQQFIQNLKIKENFEHSIKIKNAEFKQTQGNLHQVLYFDINIVPVDWENNENCFMITLNDITELNLLEKYKNDLLSTVSHELKTPLNSIISMIQIFQNDESLKLDEKLESFIESMHINSQFLLNLVQDILDQAQISKKSIKIISQKFELKNLSKHLQILFKQMVKMKGVQFNIINNLDDDLIVNDQQRLKQILINFISNAFKFTKKGSINVIFSHDLPKNRNFIKVQVKDTGDGISKEAQQKLFQKFSTFNNEQRDNNYGIGLGLNISQELVGKLGPTSKIDIFSQKQKGTTFTFYIHKKLPEIEDSMYQNSTQSIQDSVQQIQFNNNNLDFRQLLTNLLKHLEQYKILLVDDVDYNLFSLTSLLQSITDKFKIQTATDGVQALDLLKTNNDIDLIIIDYNMPYMNGDECCKKIRQNNDYDDIEIIANTAGGDINCSKGFKQAGVKYFVEKPISLQKLFEALYQIISKKKKFNKIESLQDINIVKIIDDK